MKISDEARELVKKMVYEGPQTIDGRKIVAFCEPLVQAALDRRDAAAYNRGLEDAAKLLDKLELPACSDSIRAMKVPE